MKVAFKNILKFLIFVIPFLVLVVPDAMFFPFITGRAFLFRVAIDLAVGIYLGLIILDKDSRPKNNFLNWCVFSLVVVAFAADCFAFVPLKALWSNYERMEGFATIAHLAIFFLISSTIFSAKDWRRFIYVSLGVATFMAYYSGIQMIGEIGIDQGSTRIDGTLGNAAYLAIFFAFHAFFLLMLLFGKPGKKLKGIAESVGLGSLAFVAFYIYKMSVYKLHPSAIGWLMLVFAIALSVVLAILRYFDYAPVDKREKVEKIVSTVLYLFGFAVFSWLVYETQTRGTTLGLLGGLLVASIYILVREKHDKAIRKISWGYIILLLVVVGGFFIIKNTSFVQNNQSLDRFATISWSDSSNQARQYIWPMAVEGSFSSVKTSIIGWGQEGFIYVFAKYYDPRLWSQEPWFDRAHNEFLDWLVAGGLLGFLAYVSIYVAAVRMVIKSPEFPEQEKALIIGAIAAYAFHNLFVFDNLSSYILFFTLLGFIMSRHQGERELHSEKEENQAKIYLPLGLVLGIILAFWINLNPYEQNITLIDALRQLPAQNGVPYSCVSVTDKISSDGSVQEVCNNAEPTLDLFKKALAYNTFGEAETRQFLLETASNVDSDPNTSNQSKEDFALLVISEYQKQIKENPYFETPYFDFGSYLESIGQFNQAKTVFEAAVSLSPTRQLPYMKLGEIDLEQNDINDAISYFKKAYDLDHTYPLAESEYAMSLVYGKDLKDALPLLADLPYKDGGITPNLVQILGQSGYGSYAVAMLQKRISIAPQDQSAYVLLSEVYIALKDPADSAKVINLLEAKNPKLDTATLQYLETLSSTTPSQA